jgi:hypothetical protein
MLEADEPPCRQPEYRELTSCDQEVAGGGLFVQLAHLLTRNRGAELGP